MKQILVLFVIILTVAVNSHSAELQANVARIDITPPLKMKFALGGYGARISKPARGIHDPIRAKALVLRDRNRKFVMVTMDILALPPNFKPAVLKELSHEGWVADNVLFLPSHAHTSLDMTALNDKNNLNIPQIGLYQPRLLKFVVKKMVQLIRKADHGLKPVVIGTSRTTIEKMNRNRRGGACVDCDLTVTRIDLKTGDPLAVLVNWTAHPTLMDENDMLVSAGWPGFLQQTLESEIGDGILALYFNGAEADQSPVRPDGATHYEQAEVYGKKIATEALKIYQNIVPEENPAFAYCYKKIILPPRVAHPFFKTTGGAEYGLNDRTMKVLLTVLCPQKSETTALRIGDLLIAGVPGEMECSIGLKIKNRLHAEGIKYPVIGGLANEWISYILTAKQYKKGGYESSVSFYGPGLAEAITTVVLTAAEVIIKNRNL